MSKILELLNYNKLNKKTGLNENRRDEIFLGSVKSENLGAYTKEKLANTYIFNPAEKNIKTPANSILKIPLGKEKEVSRISLSQIFPWLITFFSILLLFVNIAYRGKIIVKIDILNENAAKFIPNNSKEATISKETISEAAGPQLIPANNVEPISISLVGNGNLNNLVVKKIGFYGAALSKSQLTEDGLFLLNDGTAGYASVGLDLFNPMDLTDSTLDFFIKGTAGNESLIIFLRDAKNKSYLPQVNNVIFNKNMGQDWQFMSIPFNDFKGNYNPTMINHIGFEFGTQTALNTSGTAIYIKNIKILKNILKNEEKERSK